MDRLVNVVEAILFAAGVPIRFSEIMEKLPEDVSRKNLKDAISKIAEKYSGDSGILLQEFDDKLQFCSNDKYGEIVAATLQPVKEKALTNSLMETLSIVAYFQPVTRASIEDLKGGVSADYAISMLMKANLIRVSGQAPTIGRPLLYSTTDEFLKKFDLRDLSDLPAADEVKKRMIELGSFGIHQEGLYRADGMNLDDDVEQETSASIQQNQEFEDFISDDDTPEFLKDDNYDVYDGSKNEDGEIESVAADVNEDSSTDDDDNMPI